jgi:hypothetical protein
MLTAVAEQQQRSNDLTYAQFSKKSLVEFGSTIEKMVDDADSANTFLLKYKKEQQQRASPIVPGKAAGTNDPKSGRKKSASQKRAAS